MQKALAAWILLAMAPASSQTPTEVLQNALRQVVAVLEEEAGARALDRRRAELRRIADRLFDVHDMARRSLGRHWSERTREEQDEFVRAFRELVEGAYVARIEQVAGERVIWGAESIDGEVATVRSRMASRQGEVSLHYRMRLVGGRWAVFDVIVDGISLVSSYRSQFARIIQTASYEELLRRMRRGRDLAATIQPTGAR
jgi:phospholipid transport system substrate-binding protein